MPFVRGPKQYFSRSQVTLKLVVQVNISNVTISFQFQIKLLSSPILISFYLQELNKNFIDFFEISKNRNQILSEFQNSYQQKSDE